MYGLKKCLPLKLSNEQCPKQNRKQGLTPRLLLMLSLPHPTSGAGRASSACFWDGTSPQKPAPHFLLTVFHHPVSSQPLCLSPLNTQLSFPFRLISAQLSPNILPLIPSISLPSHSSQENTCKHSSHPMYEEKLKGAKPLKNLETISSALLPHAQEGICCQKPLLEGFLISWH